MYYLLLLVLVFILTSCGRSPALNHSIEPAPAQKAQTQNGGSASMPNQVLQWNASFHTAVQAKFFWLAGPAQGKNSFRLIFSRPISSMHVFATMPCGCHVEPGSFTFQGGASSAEIDSFLLDMAGTWTIHMVVEDEDQLMDVKI